MRAAKKTAPPSQAIKYLLWLMTVLFIGCAVYGSYSLLSSMTGYKMGNNSYDQLRELALVTPRPTSEPTPTPAMEVVAISVSSSDDQAPAAKTTAAPSPTATPQPINFRTLQAINSDVIAWLRMPGTVIDYPVVQTNNNTKYLSCLFDGTSNPLGTLFMDYENKGGFSDQHILIYGHDMQDGSMFGSLENYSSATYYRQHPEAYIYLPNGDAYRLIIFAAARLGAFRSMLPVAFDSDDEFLAYVSEIRALSSFSVDITITSQDHVLSLCTCVTDSPDYRFIVSGKLVPMT